LKPALTVGLLYLAKFLNALIEAEVLECVVLLKSWLGRLFLDLNRNWWWRVLFRLLYLVFVWFCWGFKFL